MAHNYLPAYPHTTTHARGFVTLIVQESGVGGLQVLRGEEWVDVPAVEVRRQMDGWMQPASPNCGVACC